MGVDDANLNPSTWETNAGGSLVYIACSRTAKATQRNLSLNPTQKKRKKEERKKRRERGERYSQRERKRQRLSK